MLRSVFVVLVLLVFAACANDAHVGGPGSEDGGGTDGGSSDGAVRFATEPVAAPPSYLGTTDDGAPCATEYLTRGFEPVDTSARHPLFLYFAGTSFVATDVTTHYDSQAATAVTLAMAKRGFVALSAQYDNGATAWLSDHVNQLACLFGDANAQSLLAVACGLPNVDCNLGIATWGHSQGALIADLAATFDTRVRAVWTTGYGGDPRATLSRDRFRVVNGENDTANAAVPGLDTTAGFTTTECPDDGRKECLRADGSGWIIVQQKDCLVTSADHCWFDKKTCLDTPETLEPNWVDATSTKPFALDLNADWVSATLSRQ